MKQRFMFISSKWVFKQRAVWHKSSTSALRGVLKHLQTCHYCSSWNEHQKRGRSPTVKFRKLPYYCFDISNSSRFKHAVFEVSQFLENVKNNTDTLQRGGFAYGLSNGFLDETWCCPVNSTSKHELKELVFPPPFSSCSLCAQLSNHRWNITQRYTVCIARSVTR